VEKEKVRSNVSNLSQGTVHPGYRNKASDTESQPPMECTWCGDNTTRPAIYHTCEESATNEEAISIYVRMLHPETI